MSNNESKLSKKDLDEIKKIIRQEVISAVQTVLKQLTKVRSSLDRIESKTLVNKG